MSIIGIDNILHDQQPEVHDRHLLPDLLACRWIAVMDCLENLILLERPKFREGLVEHMPGYGVYSLKAEPVSHMVRWHIFKTISINALAIKPFVDIVHNRNFVLL